MRPPAPAREAVAAAIALIAAFAIELRLRPGDERRQAIDTRIGHRRLGLRLRLILRLGPMLALLARFTVLARLLLLALIGLTAFTMAIVAHIGLRLLLLRNEARLLSEIRKTVGIVVAVLACDGLVAARLRLVLTEFSCAAAIRRK